MVGAKEGEIVGALEGLPVGNVVGMYVGHDVGAFDGILVLKNLFGPDLSIYRTNFNDFTTDGQLRLRPF